ncbi:RNA polymerase sigma-70 factor [Niabella beijingensis]|uniref:RNA polymerase sigma-70 factor n=1 Tax=Niabella beijingensis TaxID=2872700 RepID=UPI001CBF34CA|nr:RNA polymerase sigma-70 factor [Niabella beijingensis]MBZ4190167.1 RNA polymerase sigma-70 factor [Niabella beijingensis]
MNSNRLQYLVDCIANDSDERAFDELLRFYFPGLLSFANTIVKDKWVSEEIVEDVFVKLWKTRNMLPAIKNLSNYLYIAVKYAGINYLQSRDFTMIQRKEVLDNLGDDYFFSLKTPETRLISAENLAAIAAVINTLPAQCRLIFRLVKEEGLKYNEVAQLLNLSPRTVGTQMTRAVSRIAETLAELFPEVASRRGKKAE